MQNGQADRVPCTPDFSCMIPCRRTGKPFWESLLFGNPPHWQAYLDTADYFGIDAWFVGGLDFQYDDGVTIDSRVVERTEHSVLNRWTARTPEGECGKEMHIVRRAAECTDLSCINPLEILPMGDCDLAEIKRRYGHKLALMGNLHTTEVMLRGTVEQVKAAARQAIEDAGKGGGFILSTGDQCGRDTPDENIFALVDTCKTDGRY